jgi:hypothetical protein
MLAMGEVQAWVAYRVHTARPAIWEMIRRCKGSAIEADIDRDIPIDRRDFHRRSLPITPGDQVNAA